jgi:hypothetical protein
MTTKTIVFVALAAALTAGCSSRPSNDRKKVLPVSETPPKLERLQPTSVLANTYSPSQGDCAPKYANGQIGTCINNQACRGLGVLSEKGDPACACYGKAGGCDAGERCDAKMKRCVAEKAPSGVRAH